MDPQEHRDWAARERRAFEQLKTILAQLEKMTVEEIVAMLEREGIKSKLHFFDQNNDYHSPIAKWISRRIDWPYGVHLVPWTIYLQASLYHVETPLSVFQFECNWRDGKYPQLMESYVGPGRKDHE